MAGDKSPWSALNDQAEDGKLEFDSSVAYDAADLAATTIGYLLAIKEVAKDIDEPKAFSNLPSGEALGKKLAQKGTDISDVLGKHIDILEDMIETFKSAGKAYDGSESDNKTRFDDIAIPDRPAKLPSSPPVASSIPGPVDDNGNYTVDDYDAPKEHEAHDITGQRKRLRNHDKDKFESSLIMGENADAQSYENLYQLGQSITNHSTAQRAANWSGKWYWMAEKTRAAFVELFNTMDSITADQWKGAGKKAAVAAIKGYAESVPTLTKNMNLIGDNLLYTAGWLEATRVSMPQTPNNPKGQEFNTGGGYQGYSGGGGLSTTETVEDPTPQYRQNMKDTYLHGLPRSANRVPTLPSPTAAFSDIPPIDNKPTKENPNGGRNQYANNGGTGPGGPGGIPANVASPGGAGGGTSAGGGVPAGGGAPPPPMRNSPPGQSQDGQKANQQQATQVAAQQRAAQQAAAKQQAQQQKQQQQQQKQQEQQQAAQQGQQATQQASQMAQQLGQQLSSGAQQAAQQQMAGAMPRAALDQAAAAKAAGLGDPKAGGGGGAGAGAGRSSPVGGPPSAQNTPAETAKLFPRAEGAPPGAGGAPRAGAAPMGATPGAPGPAGAAGRPASGGGGNEQDHRRPAYLDSTEHLDEALGDAPQVVRPVVER